MGRPKALKPILIGCACLVPVGLVVGLSVNWNHTTFISAVGSSATKPFIEDFGAQYHKLTKKFDVATESGGSAFGINQVVNGLATIGNVSNNPYDQVQQYDWSRMKTFTLGWEGIVLMYKMPDFVGQYAEDAKANFDIEITKDNIKFLYAAFSCFNETKDIPHDDWDETKTSYYAFLTPESRSWFDTHPDYKEVCLGTQIIPYVRSGGNTGSASSIAFSMMSHLMDFEDLTDNQQKAFAGGQYGRDRVHHETEDANARAWEMFSYRNEPGAMTYLTASFIHNNTNWELIQKKGYKLARYKSVDASQSVEIDRVEFSNICMPDGYNWFRPINCIIDLDNEVAKDFIFWMFFNTLDKTISRGSAIISTNYFMTVLGKGAKPLLGEYQFNTMCDTSITNWYESMFAKDDMNLDQYSDHYCGAKEFV